MELKYDTMKVLQHLRDVLKAQRKQHYRTDGSRTEGHQIVTNIVANQMRGSEKDLPSEVVDEFWVSIANLNELIRRGDILAPENPKSWFGTNWDMQDDGITSDAARYIYTYLHAVMGILQAIELDWKSFYEFRKTIRDTLINTSTKMPGIQSATIPLGKFYGNYPSIYIGEWEADLNRKPDGKIVATLYNVKYSEKFLSKEKIREERASAEIYGDFIMCPKIWLYFTKSVI